MAQAARRGRHRPAAAHRRNGVHADRVHAERDQVPWRPGPLLSQRDVVLDGPALVGVAFDRDDELRVRLERLPSSSRRGPSHRPLRLLLVELEVDVPERRAERTAGARLAVGPRPALERPCRGRPWSARRCAGRGRSGGPWRAWSAWRSGRGTGAGGPGAPAPGTGAGRGGPGAPGAPGAAPGAAAPGALARLERLALRARHLG